MCILFVYVAAQQPCQKIPKSSIKLILASNRDEYYNRRSLPLCQWDSTDILAGQDAEEGGTWLGMSKTGKISALLNIVGAKDVTKTKLSRGFLTTDFLRSAPDFCGWMYCNNLYNDPDLAIRSNMNPFNFVTIDLLGSNTTTTSTAQQSNQQTNESAHSAKRSATNFDRKVGESGSTGSSIAHSPTITYMTNSSTEPPIKLIAGHQSQAQTLAFGNSVYEKPFRKVTTGCQQFENIISKYNEQTMRGEDKVKLKNDLLKFLKSTDKNFPDTQLEGQFKKSATPPEFVPLLSSRFIKLPAIAYGTRTHSIIIVDSENHVEFYESTLKEPIDIENPLWTDSKYEFTLPCQNNKL